MSTTLIVAVAQRTPDAEGFPVEIGVVAGDSAAYLLELDSGVLRPVGGGKTGDGPIASTGVRPLPGAVEPTSHQIRIRPGEMLAVGTDGIGDPVGDGTNDVGRELANRWKRPPPIDQFLVDVNFYRRTFDDDRTCVGLWVRPETQLPEADVCQTVEQADELPEDDALAGVATPSPSESPPLVVGEAADDLTALVDAVSGSRTTPSQVNDDQPNAHADL